MSLKQALNFALSLKQREITIMRPATPTNITATIKISPSNYFRNTQGPSETVIKGREFVISREILDAVSWGVPKRGDKLIDAETGTKTISEVIEMFDLGGPIIAYRIRTE